MPRAAASTAISGEYEATEDYGPLVPVSTYGASKLAGEALISAYAAMFDITARAFRFGNVVGRRQTHGVGFDFVRRLLEDPTRLRILGDGQQSKSYIHVDDVVAAVLLAAQPGAAAFEVFNVATGDYITVTEIADLAIEVLGLAPGRTQFEYTGGDRGWKGDVPVVRLNTDRIRSLGWTNRRTEQALCDSLDSMVEDARAGRLARSLRGAARGLSRPRRCAERGRRARRPTHATRTLSDFRVRPGVLDACGELHEAGYTLVVTNQPDIARGIQTHGEVGRIHERLRDVLPLDDIVVCPHDDDDACRCRKPRPGMLLDAAHRVDLDLSASVIVGDRWRDVEAGHRAGSGRSSSNAL